MYPQNNSYGQLIIHEAQRSRFLAPHAFLSLSVLLSILSSPRSEFVPQRPIGSC